MCKIVRSKAGNYVRLCARYLDRYGVPEKAEKVETSGTYRDSYRVPFNGQPPIRYDDYSLDTGSGWQGGHYDA